MLLQSLQERTGGLRRQNGFEEEKLEGPLSEIVGHAAV